MDNNDPFGLRNAATDDSGRLACLLQESEEHFRIVLLTPTGDEYMRTPILVIEDLKAIYGSLTSWHTGEEGE